MEVRIKCVWRWSGGGSRLSGEAMLGPPGVMRRRGQEGFLGHRSQSTDNRRMLAGVAGERAMCPAFSARTNEKLATQHLLKVWPSPFIGMSDQCKGWGLTWEVVVM